MRLLQGMNDVDHVRVINKTDRRRRFCQASVATTLHDSGTFEGYASFTDEGFVFECGCETVL